MDVIQCVWIILTAVCIIIETATVGLTTIWFAAGTASALISSVFGAPEWLQILIAIAASIAALFLIRPLFQKKNMQ